MEKTRQVGKDETPGGQESRHRFRSSVSSKEGGGISSILLFSLDGQNKNTGKSEKEKRRKKIKDKSIFKYGPLLT